MAAPKTKKPVKTASAIGATHIKLTSESRFSPLRNLEPETLVRYIEAFEAGDFAWLDRTMRAMERRDDTWKVTASKARKDVSRRKWTVGPLEGFERDPEAADQADKLTEFYGTLRAVDFNCRNVDSGVRGLIAGMMRCYNDQFSVHELVFAADASGRLSAQAIRCPLEWFGLRDGQMCLVVEGSTATPLVNGEWLIAQGDGVGIACAVAYMFKRLALGDWAVYSGRCGQPGIHGKTAAGKGTPQWSEFVQAIRMFGREWACATGLDDVIEKVDLSVNGTLPYPGLVERMDRAIAALQRGADLSTLSAGSGAGDGASLQGDEAELITADNCATITESCRAQIDPIVLRWYFGDDVQIKCGFRLEPPQADTIERDLKIDAQLLSQGVHLSKSDALSRYVRREVDAADPDDAPLIMPVSPPPMPGFANEAEPGSSDPVAKRQNLLAKSPDADARPKSGAKTEGPSSPLSVALAAIEAGADPEVALDAYDRAAAAALVAGTPALATLLDTAMLSAVTAEASVASQAPTKDATNEKS